MSSKVILGAREIAAHIFGEATATNVRRVRHLASIGQIPVFHLGGQLAIDPCQFAQWTGEKRAEARQQALARQHAVQERRIQKQRAKPVYQRRAKILQLVSNSEGGQ